MHYLFVCYPSISGYFSSRSTALAYDPSALRSFCERTIPTVRPIIKHKVMPRIPNRNRFSWLVDANLAFTLSRKLIFVVVANTK